MSVEAVMAAETLAYWFHLDDPLTNWERYLTLCEGLSDAKGHWRAALVERDTEAAGRLLAEPTDLNTLAATAAECLAMQRARFMDSGHLWPLARLPAI